MLVAADCVTLEEEKFTFIGQGQPGIDLLSAPLSQRIIKNEFGGRRRKKEEAGVVIDCHP